MPREVLKLKRFLIWWLIDTPKNVFVTLKRFVLILNNEISFTLNIKLLFTPLFGDFTIIGRMIGFCVRVMQIISGSVLMITLLLATLLVPVLWWAAPFYGFTLSILFTIVGIIAMYFVWYLLNENIPYKKTYHDLNDKNILQSFRPKTLVLYKGLEHNWSTGVQRLCNTSAIKEVLLRAELANQDFIDKIAQSPAPNIDNVKKMAFEEAKVNKARYVETEHLFFSVIESTQNIDNIFAVFGEKRDTIQHVINWIVKEREDIETRFVWNPDYEMMYMGGIGKGLTGVITPYLDAASVDFTKLAQQGRLRNILGHKDKIKEIAEMLKGSKNNILIIGPAGCGKTSVVKGIANEIIEGTEYKTIQNKRIVNLELSGLIAGTSSAGQIAQKIKQIVSEVRRSRDIILFIDEIHTTVSGLQTDTAETSSIFSILEPIVSDEDIQVIGATTIKNYRKFIEPNEAFSRLFHIVELTQTSPEETIEILKDNARKLESKHNIKVTFPAMITTIKLADKLIQERVHPDKALDIIERAALKVTKDHKILNKSLVEKEISQITHVPVENITENEAKKLLDMEENIKKTVIGQDHAVKMISAALKRARVGIRDEEKPIASFLFVGTTGVGKTQTAKSLARAYFGSEKQMIRIDMSEYQQLDSINRLIGSPDGSMRGYLTDQVRQKPFSVVLLDEIEKAHPNILLLFLQVLDEGFITDVNGLKISFSNTMIIATSNVGTREIQKMHTENKEYEEIKDKALIEVRNHYAPEFLNRFTSIIVYKPLDKVSIRKITHLQLKGVKEVAEEKNIQISFSEELIDKLIEKGYNPEWGARPLRRVIEDTVESYLATKILTQEIKEGDVIELGLEVFEEN